MFGLGENQKIGAVLLGIAVTLYTLGCLFFFDRALLIFGNLCFLGGLYFMVGIGGSIGFFMKKGKIQYSAIFFLGFFVIVIGLAFVGGIMQLYSLFLLFRSFLPVIFDSLFSLPGIGPFLSNLGNDGREQLDHEVLV